MLQVVDTDAAVRAVLAQARKALTNTRPVMAAIGRALEQNVQLRFDTKTSPSGHPWAPWSPATARARATEGRGTLLEYSDRMRASLTYYADNDSVTVGLGVPYAAAHEFGTSRLPKRPMLFDNGHLGADDTADILAAAQAAMARNLP